MISSQENQKKLKTYYILQPQVIIYSTIHRKWAKIPFNPPDRCHPKTTLLSLEPTRKRTAKQLPTHVAKAPVPSLLNWTALGPSLMSWALECHLPREGEIPPWDSHRWLPSGMDAFGGEQPLRMTARRRTWARS